MAVHKNHLGAQILYKSPLGPIRNNLSKCFTTNSHFCKKKFEFLLKKFKIGKIVGQPCLDLTADEFDYIDRIQNIIGNFIRTGNPNDWTGNKRPIQNIQPIRNWRDFKKFNIFGISGQSDENYRNDFCNSLDEMDEYMLH